jgi:hypothetical protein
MVAVAMATHLDLQPSPCVGISDPRWQFPQFCLATAGAREYKFVLLHGRQARIDSSHDQCALKLGQGC